MPYNSKATRSVRGGRLEGAVSRGATTPIYVSTSHAGQTSEHRD